MALQLQLDGQNIGQIGDDGKLADSEGNPVVQPQPKPSEESVEVPLLTGVELAKLQAEQGGKPEEKPAEEEPEESPEEEYAGVPDNVREAMLSKDHKISELANTVKVLEQAVSQLRAMPPSAQRQQLSQATESLIKDHIPEGLSKEEDKFGLAATLKGMVRALNTTIQKVDRLDSHANFTEGMRMLELEKGKHDVFKDEKLGPLAEKVLQAELGSSGDPVNLIVLRVAQQFEGVGSAASKKYVKKKVQQAKKTPAGVRSKDGASHTITIDKPKDVRQAGDRYRAWRSARERAHKG